MELLEANLPITIYVNQADHFVDFLVSDLLTQCIHDESDFSCTHIPISIHIESEECLSDFSIIERLFA